MRSPSVHSQISTQCHGLPKWLQPLPATLLSLALASTGSVAQAQAMIYNPPTITPGQTIVDRLTNKDIPTGQGGFSRDYRILLKAGDQVAIDLSSDNFDTLVYLLSESGTTIAENDDGPDGSTNSLLFTRITKTGVYFIRVRAFGETAGGNFRLKVTLLKPA